MTLSVSVPQARPEAARRVGRCMAGLALLPVPLCLIWSLAFGPRPVWRAHYVEESQPSGRPLVVEERWLNARWDSVQSRARGKPGAHFSARWHTCLKLANAREIPFMLVSDGDARFLLDGEEKLAAQGEPARSTRGEVLRLEAGIHHLEVQLSARGRPIVALNASFDGNAPLPITDAALPEGVRLFLPGSGEPACERGG